MITILSFPENQGPAIIAAELFSALGDSLVPSVPAELRVHFGSRQQMKKGILHSLGRSQAAGSCKSRADRLELVSGESD